jgi:endonuclease-8
VPDGDGIHHVVAALRTALVGRAVTRFDGPRVDGPAPTTGRVIERVDCRGRHVQIVWDDGLILHSNLRLNGVWHLYREGEPWRRPSAQLRVAITVPGWVAACFNAPQVETYREFDRYRHPGFGRSGPDLCSATADLDECVRRIGAYFDPEAPIAEVLLDQLVACGVGNVYRSEALWECAIHPLATAGSLPAVVSKQLVTVAARMLRANIDPSMWEPVSDTRTPLVVYGRNGQPCERCGDTIEVRRVSEHARLLYWCTGCQTRFDPRAVRTVRERPMDPHPAAEKFVAGLPWRRDDLAG